ncbi:hypothetical protein CXG81DRAFT_14129 [Caulochytrium protostelioides]|uniref:Uncharacterized protein n=1 Tax=Caulochytrium protostelioides TaxID=1555241 RepID=A0A4P9X3V3_9FUNG|nr:hypothetical protein CXG81DRAFT_14129 [Caulochytrium protostelioides]|eukprot:RKO99726.1 hypothetical protein CXG81DRAFT_14129 [Caulochytrium protostelioides]
MPSAAGTLTGSFDTARHSAHPTAPSASNPSNPSNPADGVLVIWNIHMPSRPEFVFEATSPIVSATFSPFHPQWVVGGTFSGEIVVWDIRADQRLPILQTPLSAAGHTYPVYSMKMIGTQNTHQLVTASTDGVVCAWQLNMLAQPLEVLELMHSQHPKTDEVAITTIGFRANDTAGFYVGTEEGAVYAAQRHDRAGTRAGIQLDTVYAGHAGMVTALAMHAVSGPVDFSDLFLTASVDWTVKLWQRASSASRGYVDGGASGAYDATGHLRPLLSFEDMDDYVMDVKWSPVHPAVFATADASGCVALYDLNADLEVPAFRFSTGTAVNKIAWNMDGTRLVAGTTTGAAIVFDVGFLPRPQNEDWLTLQHVLSEQAVSGY